jgi:hypothetical protein
MHRGLKGDATWAWTLDALTVLLKSELARIEKREKDQS